MAAAAADTLATMIPSHVAATANQHPRHATESWCSVIRQRVKQVRALHFILIPIIKLFRFRDVIPWKLFFTINFNLNFAALVNQFMTSEYMHTYDASLDDEFGEKTVSILLDGEESELIFIDHPASEMSVSSNVRVGIGNCKVLSFAHSTGGKFSLHLRAPRLHHCLLNRTAELVAVCRRNIELLVAWECDEG